MQASKEMFEKEKCTTVFDNDNFEKLKTVLLLEVWGWYRVQAPPGWLSIQLEPFYTRLSRRKESWMNQDPCSIWKCFYPLRLFEGVTSRYLLSFLKLKRFSYQLNSKNNASVLLFKTIFRKWICSLASVAADGKDGYGFKLDKARPILSSFNDVTAKITKKLNMVSAP